MTQSKAITIIAKENLNACPADEITKEYLLTYKICINPPVLGQGEES